MKSLSRLSLLALLLLGLAACDSGDPDDAPGFGGKASVKVTGAVAKTFSARAIFTLVTEDGKTYFNLLLADKMIGEDAAHAVLLQRLGQRPAVGTYAVDGADVLGLYMGESGEEDDWIVGADAGELKITRSAADVVEGTFSFTGFLFGSEDEVTVTGSFEAKYVEDAPDLSKMGH